MNNVSQGQNATMLSEWMITLPRGSIFLRDDRKKKTWLASVEPFQISKYLVTQKIYSQVMGRNPATFIAAENPVESVSWLDAVTFCNKLSELSGLNQCYEIDLELETAQLIESSHGYRLPTDAEWEYACRANHPKAQYGNVDDIAWYEENSAESTHEVGLKAPNNFGLYDMLGNVWEWCWDLYDPEVYGSYRIFRGGGWSDVSRSCLASNRRRSHPTYAIDDLGFRLARSVA